MSVIGGWRGGLRFASAGGVGLLAVAIGGGCGSRTSVLDVEAYEQAGPGYGGSSSFGGSGSFSGKTSTIGGKASGTAGTTASAGAPSSVTIAECADYCVGYGKTCLKELKGRDCQQVCQAEIDGYGIGCQTLGRAAIQCLSPFFKAGGTCSVATNQGLMTCGEILAAFKSCEMSVAPTPTPTPTPSPGFDPTTCDSMGGVDVNSCEMVFACAQGVYRTSCSPTFDGKATHCACFHNESGFMGDMPLTSYQAACYLAASWCDQGFGGTGGL